MFDYAPAVRAALRIGLIPCHKVNKWKHCQITEQGCQTYDFECDVFNVIGLVRFVPINIDDEESIQDLLMQIDNVIQYGEDADVKIRDFDPPDEDGADYDDDRNKSPI